MSEQPTQVKPTHNHNYRTLLTKINPIRPLTRASIPKKRPLKQYELTQKLYNLTQHLNHSGIF
jgi:hypothetical protein